MNVPHASRRNVRHFRKSMLATSITSFAVFEQACEAIFHSGPLVKPILANRSKSVTLHLPSFYTIQSIHAVGSINCPE